MFRFKIAKGGNDAEMVRGVWKDFIAGIEISSPGVTSLSGTSLNLEQQLFLGMVGWQRVDVSDAR